MNDQQLLRYRRHTLLDEAGIEGQQTLPGSRALIIGVGGWTRPPLAGIGSLRAAEALKLLMGTELGLSGTLLSVNTLNPNIMRSELNFACRVCCDNAVAKLRSMPQQHADRAFAGGHG